MVIIAALAAAVVVALLVGYFVGERAGRQFATAAPDPAPAAADLGAAVGHDDEITAPAAFRAGAPAVVVLPSTSSERAVEAGAGQEDRAEPGEAPDAGEGAQAGELAGGPAHAGQDPGPAPLAEEVATLWELELARVEREWRIATVPLDVPFNRTSGPGDRLRAALQMELERHREQSGGDASVDGAAADGLSPAVALAALRLTQETVAELGRLSDRLIVELAGDEATARVTVKARGVDVPPGFADWLAAAAGGLGAGSTVTRGPEAVVEITVPAGPDRDGDAETGPAPAGDTEGDDPGGEEGVGVDAAGESATAP